MRRISTAVLLLCAACGDDEGAALDGGGDAAPTPDGGPIAEDGGPVDAGTDAGARVRHSYVVDGLTLPTDAMSATDLGRDVDGDGSVDNQLGQIVAALGATSTDVDSQATIDEAVLRGDVIVLIELQTSDGARAWEAPGTLSMGTSACTDPMDLSTCGQHLDGTGMFDVTLPVPAFGEGSIVAGRLEVPLPEASVPIALLTAVAPLSLRDVLLEADFAPARLTNGRLTGVLPETRIDAEIVVPLHEALVRAIDADCAGGTCVPGSTGETLLGTFDEDGDGAVSLDDVRASSLLSELLRPDVDTDANGTADSVSVGVGFRAGERNVRCPPLSHEPSDPTA